MGVFAAQYNLQGIEPKNVAPPGNNRYLPPRAQTSLAEMVQKNASRAAISSLNQRPVQSRDRQAQAANNNSGPMAVQLGSFHMHKLRKPQPKQRK